MWGSSSPSGQEADAKRRVPREPPEASFRKKSGELLQKSSDKLLAALHQESKWESQGGWVPASRERRHEYHMERDASMVNLLNLIDPHCLVDNKPVEIRRPGLQQRGRSESITLSEQHSSLSQRGVMLVGAASTFAWYVVRLVLRDVTGIGSGLSEARRNAFEMHMLSSLHATGWVVFLLKKIGCSAAEWPQYCSRALVASLGFYLHDCWALRGTLLRNPAMLAHQAIMAATITSILRSKGVAWLAPPLMSTAIPTLVQELLQLCGTVGLPATRPEVRGLRLLWFISFAISKLALVPLWLRHHSLPELHQPSLLLGKAAYSVCLALNLRFMVSAARDLPSFLAPKGVIIPASSAYRIPLKGLQATSNTVVASMLLALLFGLYGAAPIAALVAALSARRGSSRAIRCAAGVLCSAVALDYVVPMPSECWKFVRVFMPIFRKIPQAFHHKIYPQQDLSKFFRKDRHYLVAVTPHGFFPWGVAVLLLDMLDQGYLPNFIGASVLSALPLAGRLLRAFGYRPATQGEIRRCLKKTYPRNITIIVPGGIREMFCIRRDIEVSAGNLRMGFVELAREGGAMLVPGYMFGSSQLYQVAEGPLADLFEQFSRKTRTSIAPFHGLWGTVLPYPQPLASALAEPIDTLQVTDDKAIHGLWVERVRDVFNKYKALYGWPSRKLYFEGEALPPRPHDPMDAYTALPRLSKL